MRSSVVLKRVLPFVLALAAGLFVASFFVDIMPRFNVRDYRIQRCDALQRLRIENDVLRRQNQDLRDQIDSFRRVHDNLYHVPRSESLRYSVPPPPVPPVAPQAVR